MERFAKLYNAVLTFVSCKQRYKQPVGAEDLETEVRTLMEDQHRGIVQALKRGKLDESIGLAPASGRASSSSGGSAAEFGEGIITDEPLDEVILAHLGSD